MLHVGTIPDEDNLFFNWSIPSSHTMALESTHHLRAINTRNQPGGKRRLARKADKLGVICEPTV
jgi:hypothetical protein